ncbi:threonine--tRNA ligase [Helicobacter sp. 16-1353]|uniref:threonine--tRNA ligase n=1 Tax=Helicobacter sp. 16-1353 TaxID=2004996 RepID=UPI000DCB74C5|nr:threonine--tRNA ligase [Helicobacter sp. 16-1353]RAX54204.1 threonine--tRNA ligase [Helicobacter sp. 16-1353]
MSELIGFKKDNKIFDLQTAEELKFNTDEYQKIYFDDSSDALSIIRHSCAHLMAQAIKQLYTNAKFFVGPVVDEGFYYDFKVDEKIGIEDLAKIEAKMREIAKKPCEIKKEYMDRSEALRRFSGDELKMAVMKNIDGDTFSTYAQDDFEDLCRGPHIPNVNLLVHFKLTKLAGAYLGGDESAEMLTRIYGIAFASKEALKAYNFMVEEALKRDHRKLGNELGIFTFDEDIGAGLPIWLPKGARIRRNIENILTRALINQEYEPVRGPEILKSDLWKISGHYQNYKENMYFTTIDNIEYGIKPMNCLGHIKVYQSDVRSYRDLPLRFYEYGVVHRHEKSGVLHGLLRVREFTQDDAHIFCRPNQIKSEIESIVKFASRIMEIFGFKYEMEISTKPEKYIGSDEVWVESTNALKEILKANNIDYSIDEGGGAFYGPKIDIKITDAIGRKWQCGTVQIDMNLPNRFNLAYIDEDNSPKQPVMIHRAILGSFERFIAILTEHYGGEFPLFIAPTQAIIVPINSECEKYARILQLKLREIGAYAETNTKNESLNKRICTAEKQKVPYILVIGDKEVEAKAVAVRDRREKTQYNLSEEEFLNKIDKEMKEGHF